MGKFLIYTPQTSITSYFVYLQRLDNLYFVFVYRCYIQLSGGKGDMQFWGRRLYPRNRGGGAMLQFRNLWKTGMSLIV